MVKHKIIFRYNENNTMLLLAYYIAISCKDANINFI